MNEDIQVIAFDLIFHSGSARTIIHESFAEMRTLNFTVAKDKLNEANEFILKAHQVQTKLLSDYANGKNIELEIILIHAQDHLMNTMTLQEVALEMLEIYRRMA